MSILIGSTGFVGGHLSAARKFDQSVNSSNADSIAGVATELLVCAGLPADKWRINNDSLADFQNMSRLAQILCSVRASRAVLISTVDVYQPPHDVNEQTPPTYNGPQGYGRNRAWFEAFFVRHFPQAVILRLPGLYARNVRKNFVHDLLWGKRELFENVNPDSHYQFYDATKIWSLAESAWELDIPIINVCSEPVSAGQIARVFGEVLHGKGEKVFYDMQTLHAETLGGEGSYLVRAADVLADLQQLRDIGPSA